MYSSTLHSIFKFLEEKRDRRSPLFYKMKYFPNEIEEEDLTVEELYLGGPVPDWLPDNLTVRSSLRMIYSAIAKFPKNPTIGDTLEIMDCDVREFPSDLKVGKKLIINKSEQIIDIPPTFKMPPIVRFRDTPHTKVGGNWENVEIIDFSYMGLDKFPDISHPLDTIILYDTSLGYFPDGLIVKDFIIDSCLAQIEELPRNLTVTGTLKIVPSQKEWARSGDTTSKLLADLEERGGKINEIVLAVRNIGSGW